MDSIHQILQTHQNLALEPRSFVDHLHRVYHKFYVYQDPIKLHTLQLHLEIYLELLDLLYFDPKF
jgi:hypothetical protein